MKKDKKKKKGPSVEQKNYSICNLRMKEMESLKKQEKPGGGEVRNELLGKYLFGSNYCGKDRVSKYLRCWGREVKIALT